MTDFQSKANFLWSIANLIRDSFKRSKYQDVILPFTVLRRIDSVLEPTKDDVLARYTKYKGKIDNLDGLLRDASGYAFYNTSRYTFRRLLNDPTQLKQNLDNYIGGFSENMRDVLEKFDFYNTTRKLEEADLLYQVMERFGTVDLHPDTVSNQEMGYIFEELIRKFNEALNENPGEHFTPREVVRLMTRLVLAGEKERLSTPGVVRKVYDPCCGTGGMLTTARDSIYQLNPEANVYLYGQEVNPETYAVCKADFFLKTKDGSDADRIAFGSTLSDDKHHDERFDYQLANPPYGKDWKRDKDAVNREADRGHAGRFGAGTPRISDGQLLFLQHMMARAKRKGEGGGRVSIIMNGSPLFTGDAGSGESEIRRWLLENDYVEAIIALPEQLFYNTGISTYVWVLSTRKAQERRGQVQLIDASDLWEPMRKSLGNKRREITKEQLDTIVALYDANEETERVQIFPNEAFGFRKIRVERPLRLNVQASAERIKRLWEERAFEKLAKSRKKDPEARRKAIEEGTYKQEQTIKMLQEMAPTLSRDYNAFRDRLKKEIKKRGLGLRKPVRTAILSALSEKDDEAEIVRDTKDRIEPDSDLRDYESVPLIEDVHAYFEREVKPHVPDAYVDEDYTDEQDGEVGRVGYEINFNRYFYTYEPPRALEEIEADLKVLQEEIVAGLQDVMTTA